MLREAGDRRTVETGGGLFGYANDHAIVIEQISVAAGATRRTPLTFTPDHRDLQAQIDRIIAASEGRSYLIGEWHTHPWGVPYLSRSDRTSVRNTADAPRTGITRPVAIVLAPTAVPRARARIGAFVWDPLSRAPARQPLRTFTPQEAGVAR